MSQDLRRWRHRIGDDFLQQAQSSCLHRRVAGLKFVIAGRARQQARRMHYPDFYARTGTLAVRSSLPQLTQAPLMARRIAFQTQ